MIVSASCVWKGFCWLDLVGDCGGKERVGEVGASLLGSEDVLEAPRESLSGSGSGKAGADKGSLDTGLCACRMVSSGARVDTSRLAPEVLLALEPLSILLRLLVLPCRPPLPVDEAPIDRFLASPLAAA